jgi:nicotinamidase-related amidase
MKQALLVIDVQNDYFKNGKMELVGPDQALDKINQLEQYFNEKIYRLFMCNILTRHKPVSFKKILKVFTSS